MCCFWLAGNAGGKPAQPAHRAGLRRGREPKGSGTLRAVASDPTFLLCRRNVPDGRAREIGSFTGGVIRPLPGGVSGVLGMPIQVGMNNPGERVCATKNFWQPSGTDGPCAKSMRAPHVSMSSAPHFLVVDYLPESRSLFAKTLLRKYPAATIHQTTDSAKALELTRAFDLRAIIAHRTTDLRGFELVRRLRDADPAVPIVMVSISEGEADARAAGANAFLSYDEWLRLAMVVDQLASRPRNSATDHTSVA
jgi:CheY-like chemotaxis protein